MSLKECLKKELQYRTSRSSGPGGQHVNKTESRVELLWDPGGSACLSACQKELVTRRLASRITGEGILVMADDTHRSQHRNREEVTARFLEMVFSSLVPPRKRHPTRPTRSSVEKRIRSKKIRGEIKHSRRKPLLSVLLLVCLFLQKDLPGQNLDSLLQNKRVYHTLSIGDLPVPKIDGLLDDAIWELGTWHGDFTQQQPVGGVRGTENTWIKVLYDRSGLFVAIVCEDSEPAKIRDVLDRRDALGGDMAGIAIDSYFDRRTAFEFNLSAAGQKMDMKHSADYKWDFNWDGVWDGATSRNDTGWIAEMKIPFSQLRYNDREEHTWGMHVWRWIARKHEEDQWQYIPREAPAMVYLFGELKGVRDIRDSRQVEFLPYMLGSLGRGPDPESSWEPGLNGGLDAKVGIGSDYTLDLTINPDFGQVEADPSELNLTTYETFFEEKRPFFLEGTEIFDFELDGDIPYYSRRIGSAPGVPEAYRSMELRDIPNRATILGAAKLTGKSQKGLSVGLVSGLTASEHALTADLNGSENRVQVSPMSNYLASRAKQEFGEGNTILGGMFTLVSRISSDSLMDGSLPAEAMSGGIDLLHYWKDRNYYFEAKTIASRLDGSAESIHHKQLDNTHRYQRPDADHLQLDPDRTQLSGHGGLISIGKKGGRYNFSFSGQYRSPGLDLNDMGYLREADIIGQEASFSYRMNEPRNRIRNYSLSLNQGAAWSFGGENVRNSWLADFQLTSSGHQTCRLMYVLNLSRLDTRELRGGPALRMGTWQTFGALLSTDHSKDLYGYAMFHHILLGEKHASRRLYNLSVTWLPVRRLKLSGDFEYDLRDYNQQYVTTITGDDKDHYLVGWIVHRSASFTFRGELFLTPELSVQYYGSPYYSVGDYDRFRRILDASARDAGKRFESVDVGYLEDQNSYSFTLGSTEFSFENPDFNFMQFRSNLVLRWEYKLGSTLYFVWSHDRSDWQGEYHPIGDITGDLFRVRGNHVFLLKLNFWFSV